VTLFVRDWVGVCVLLDVGDTDADALWERLMLRLGDGVAPCEVDCEGLPEDVSLSDDVALSVRVCDCDAPKLIVCEGVAAWLPLCVVVALSVTLGVGVWLGVTDADAVPDRVTDPLGDDVGDAVSD